jgi:hypothetical protein
VYLRAMRLGNYLQVTGRKKGAKLKRRGGGFLKGATLCPLGLDGDKSKYLQNFSLETVRNLLFGRQAREWKRYALLWEITQRIAAVPYRRFCTTYRSHLQGSIPGDQMKKGPVNDKYLWTTGALHTRPRFMSKHINFLYNKTN